MWDWYWSLSGLTWFLATFLIGAIPLGALGAIVIMSAKSIAKSFDHDRATCGCSMCETYRARQINKARVRAGEILPPIYPGMLISTTDLRPGMVVVAGNKGTPHEVVTVQRRAYGYVVILTNLNTLHRGWLTVPLDKAKIKRWKISKPRRVYGV